MHIKFLSHGTGSAGGAVSYLLGENDHLGLERAEVQVLRGNPQMVATVADKLSMTPSSSCLENAKACRSRS